LDERIQEESKK